MQENERCGKTDVGVRHKTGHWKNPLTSFWDKLGKINIFWETILMAKRDRKDTLRLNILRDTLGDNWYDDMSHILHTSPFMFLIGQRCFPGMVKPIYLPLSICP